MGNYRGDARKALARAKEELATKDDQRLKYAALELRMSMESITYDRALAYKDEFPEPEYDTSPPLVMRCSRPLYSILPLAILEPSSASIAMRRSESVSLMVPTRSSQLARNVERGTTLSMRATVRSKFSSSRHS